MRKDWRETTSWWHSTLKTVLNNAGLILIIVALAARDEELLLLLLSRGLLSRPSLMCYTLLHVKNWHTVSAACIKNDHIHPHPAPLSTCYYLLADSSRKESSFYVGPQNSTSVKPWWLWCPQNAESSVSKKNWKLSPSNLQFETEIENRPVSSREGYAKNATRPILWNV